MEFCVHTDLAMENRERFTGQDFEIEGVILKEEFTNSEKNKECGLKITRVIITDKNGEQAMNKPMGNYVSIETRCKEAGLYQYEDLLKSVLSREIKNMLKSQLVKVKKTGAGHGGGKEKLSVLAVGLGNRDVTPDALGPKVVSNLKIDRHLSDKGGISAVVPGVMAQSGIESAKIVRGVVEQIKPDAVIAVDALAAGSTRRLNTTIQLADTGIHPGSGVGNHRMGINMDTVGVPVIAIGIPTVVDAATIVNDALDKMIMILRENGGNMGLLSDFNKNEKYELIKELLEPDNGNMFVTPKDVDENIEILARLVSESINMVMCE